MRCTCVERLALTREGSCEDDELSKLAGLEEELVQPRAQEGDNTCGAGVAQAAVKVQCTAALVRAQAMRHKGSAIRHDEGFIKVQHNLQRHTHVLSA